MKMFHHFARYYCERMSLLKHFIIFVVCCVQFLDGVKFRCDYKYTELGWFKYHAIPANWRDARLRCRYEGGMLASPTTPEMKATMMQTIRKVDIFTGIHATFSRGNFHSLDGIPLDEIPCNWVDTEPDNKNDAERCISMNIEGKISDVRCDVPRPYLCYRSHTYKNANVCGTPDSEYHFESRTNKCYKFHTVPRTYERAHFVCSAEGGHLAIINSEVEATVIREIFAQYPPDKIVARVVKDVAFIGFHNWGEGAEWTTLEGQSLQDAGYAKFAQGQPDNSTGEYCGAVFRAGTLDDLWCENHYAFFCEKKPDYPHVCDSDTEEKSPAQPVY